MNSLQEPATGTAAVRRFKDPAYVPQAGTLGELRRRIDALDAQIVDLLVQRGLCVRDATRFKLDEFQVAAPQRQAQVLASVRSQAAAHESSFPGLPEIVESTYRTLVAGFVAGEARCFQETERISS